MFKIEALTGKTIDMTWLEILDWLEKLNGLYEDAKDKYIKILIVNGITSVNEQEIC